MPSLAYRPGTVRALVAAGALCGGAAACRDATAPASRVGAAPSFAGDVQPAAPPIVWYADNGSGLSNVAAADYWQANPTHPLTVLVDASQLANLVTMRLQSTLYLVCMAPYRGQSLTETVTRPLTPTSESSVFTPAGPPSNYLFGYVVWQTFAAHLLRSFDGQACSVRVNRVPVPGALQATVLSFTLTYTTKVAGSPSRTTTASVTRNALIGR